MENPLHWNNVQKVINRALVDFNEHLKSPDPEIGSSDVSYIYRALQDAGLLKEQEYLYYESHVTIEPVFDERLELFSQICAKYSFKVADLLMQKRKQDRPERSSKDSFCTGRSKEYIDLFDRTMGLVNALKEAKFQVWRYKIEGTLLDERIKNAKTETVVDR